MRYYVLLYVELAIGDRFPLTHQLVRPVAGSRHFPVFVDVSSVSCTKRFPSSFTANRTDCAPRGEPPIRFTSRA